VRVRIRLGGSPRRSRGRTGATNPYLGVAEKLMKEIRGAVEQEYLTPLDGARVTSSAAATLFGYDEFILREVSPETLLAASSGRRQ
jgi:hypothetical protein